MKKFIELLEDKITTDYPTAKDVFIDCMKRTKDYNDRTIGRHIFCPGPDYKKDFSKYMGLNHRQRVNSDGDCTGIWGVGNVDLYHMWYNYVNNPNKYPEIDRLAKIGNELLSNKDVASKVYATRIALLTPEDMINKGVYHKTDPSLNFFKIEGVIDTLDNGTPITKWFEEYQKHYSGLSSEGWTSLYPSWRSTLKTLLYELKNVDKSLDNSTEKELRIKQSIIELGWIPDIPFKSSMQCLHKLRKAKSNLPINISTYRESFESYTSHTLTKPWLLLLFVHNNGYTTPYITLNFNDMYKYIKGTLHHSERALILRPIDKITVIGYSVPDDSYAILDKLLKNFDKNVEDMNTQGFDINSTVKEGDISDNADTILKLFIQSLINNNRNSEENLIDLLKISCSNKVLIYNEDRADEVINNIHNVLNNLSTAMDEVNEPILSKELVLNKLESGDVRLNLAMLKPVAENALYGLEKELFDILYERYVGDESLYEVIDELGSYYNTNSNILLESKHNSKINEYENKINNLVSKVKHDQSDKSIAISLWKISKEIEGLMYSDSNRENKQKFGIVRAKALKEFNKIANYLEQRDSTFDIKNFINSVAALESGTYIDPVHIKHSFNSLKYK